MPGWTNDERGSLIFCDNFRRPESLTDAEESWWSAYGRAMKEFKEWELHT